MHTRPVRMDLAEGPGDVCQQPQEWRGEREMSAKGKCRSCGKEFKTDEERGSHKCPNIISTDKKGVRNEKS